MIWGDSHEGVQQSYFCFWNRMLHIRAFSHTSIIPKKMSPYSSLNKNNKALDLLNVSFQFYLKTNLPLLSKHYLIIHSAFYARAFFFQCIATQTLYYQASSTLDIHTETLPIGSNGFLLVCRTSQRTPSNKN